MGVDVAVAGGGLRLAQWEDLIDGGTTAVTLKGEAWQSRYEVEDNSPAIEGLKVDVRRVRVALEGAHERVLADGGRLRPSVEVGLRHDGGDGETGTGVDLGGGLRWADPVGAAERRGKRARSGGA